MKTYLAKQLFDGHQMQSNMQMRVNNGEITAIESATQSGWQTDIELNGTVSAGFIDTQVISSNDARPCKVWHYGHVTHLDYRQ